MNRKGQQSSNNVGNYPASMSDETARKLEDAIRRDLHTSLAMRPEDHRVPSMSSSSFSEWARSVAGVEPPRKEQKTMTTMKSNHIYREPSTGRGLHVRVAGEGRVGIFNDQGVFLMECDPQAMREAADFAGHWRQYMKTVPGLPSAAREGADKYAGASSTLTIAEMRKLSRKEIEARAELEGVSLLDVNMKTRSAGDLIKDLWAVYARRLEAPNAREVRAMRSKVEAKEKQRLDAVRALKESEVRERDLRTDRDGWCRRAEQARGEAELLAESRSAFEARCTALELKAGELERSYANREKQHADLVVKNGELENGLMGLSQQNLSLMDDAHAARVELSQGNKRIKELEKMETEQAEIAEVKTSNALAPAGEMLVQAAKLAAIQRGSKVFANRTTKLLVESGMPRELLEDARVQKLLELVVPGLLVQFGDKIPGLKNVAELQPLAQQKMVMDIANVLDVTMGDLFGMLGDVTSALNEGTDPRVEQLPSD